MRNSLLVIFFFSFFLANGQSKNNSNGNLIGIINKSDFLNGKYRNWFLKNYTDYTPDPIIVEKIKKKLQNVSIKSFIGTWCHDSKRELPKFYKIMDLDMQ